MATDGYSTEKAVRLSVRYSLEPGSVPLDPSHDLAKCSLIIVAILIVKFGSKVSICVSYQSCMQRARENEIHGVLPPVTSTPFVGNILVVQDSGDSEFALTRKLHFGDAFHHLTLFRYGLNAWTTPGKLVGLFLAPTEGNGPLICSTPFGGSPGLP